jgi:hypothetical protein
MRATIDMVPMRRGGEIIYADVREQSMRGLRGLGAATNFVNTATNVTNVTSAAAAAVPNKPVSYQSDFSKTANVVATGAGVVAAATVAIVPFGTVIAAVAGIVGAAAVLLGKIFANSKAKQYQAERGEYEMANAQLRYENEQLDNQYVQAHAAINDLKNKIDIVSGKSPSPKINGLDGLGCIIGCKKKAEKAKLMSAKEENAVLVEEQKAKTTAMATLLDEYNKMIKALLELKAKASTNDWIIWILGGSAALLTTYLVVKNVQK